MKRVASLYLPHWSIDRLRRAERLAAPSAEPQPAGAALDALGRVAADERGKQCCVPKEGGWRPGARWAKAGMTPATSRHRVDEEVAALPMHQRPPMRELGRRSEPAAPVFGRERPLPSHSNTAPPVASWAAHRDLAEPPFRPMPPDEAGWVAVNCFAEPEPFPGEGRGPASRHSAAGPRPSPGKVVSDGFSQCPDLAAWAAMPAVQFPGEGPHLDAHGRAPIAGYPGEGRFFQTGRTLGDLVARVCPEEPRFASPPCPAPDTIPLVTTHKVGGRVLIAAACPAALALGASPGMALTQARASLPGLEARPADPEGDRADLLRLAHLLARRWTPVVALSGEDGLFLDMTGTAHLHGGEARMMRRLVRLLAVQGITARVGVADSAGAAWALARHGGERIGIVPPGGAVDALAPLPVQALRIEPDRLELLAGLGIERIGQLLGIPRGPLTRRLGREVVTRLDQATGRAPEPLDPVIPPEAIQVRQAFLEPIATAEAIAHHLADLMPRLCRALAEAGRGARAIELLAERVDGIPQRLRLGFARPTRDAGHLLRLALRRIEEIDPGYGIDALALHVHRADPLGPEALGPALAEPAEPDLAPLVDALVNRIGAARTWRTRAVESDVPERSVAPAPPLDSPPREATPPRADDVRRLDQRAADHPWRADWPRPVRLLSRPEEVDHVLAELPDRPPVRFTWRGVVHRVVRADGPERITGEWWRRPAERDAVRDYFRVEDEAGARFWLYRRGDGVRPETGDLRWFLHGRFG